MNRYQNGPTPDGIMLDLSRPNDQRQLEKEARQPSARVDRISRVVVAAYAQHPLAQQIEMRYVTPQVPTGEVEDGLGAYLNSLGGHRLLTRSDEQRMFSRLNKHFEVADAMEREGRFTPTKEEDTSLAQYAGLHRSITLCNTRLVVDVAKRYLKGFGTIGHESIDMIADGNFGLVKAVNRFDIKRGFKFSTYATAWIDQEVTRQIANKSRAVRIPVHVHEDWVTMNKAWKKSETDYGRRPTIDEVAQILGQTPEYVSNLQKIGETELASLNRPAGQESDTEVGDLTPSNHSWDTDIAAISDKHEVMDLMDEAQLSVQELVVTGLRYGVSNELVARAMEVYGEVEGNNVSVTDAYTPDEQMPRRAVYRAIKMSEKRVKQLEESAMQKMQAVR